MPKLSRNGSRMDDMRNRDRENDRAGPRSIFRPLVDPRTSKNHKTLTIRQKRGHGALGVWRWHVELQPQHQREQQLPQPAYQAASPPVSCWRIQAYCPGQAGVKGTQPKRPKGPKWTQQVNRRPVFSRFLLLV